MMWRYGNECGWLNLAHAHRLDRAHSPGSGGIGPSWRIFIIFLAGTSSFLHQETFAKYDNEAEANAEFDALLALLTADQSSGYTIDVSPKTWTDDK